MFLLAAEVAVIDPQVPETTLFPPSVRLPTGRFRPAAMLAVAEPDGAILRFPSTAVLAFMVLMPLPERITS